MSEAPSRRSPLLSGDAGARTNGLVVDPCPRSCPHSPPPILQGWGTRRSIPAPVVSAASADPLATARPSAKRGGNAPSSRHITSWLFGFQAYRMTCCRCHATGDSPSSWLIDHEWRCDPSREKKCQGPAQSQHRGRPEETGRHADPPIKQPGQQDADQAAGGIGGIVEADIFGGLLRTRHRPGSGRSAGRN